MEGCIENYGTIPNTTAVIRILDANLVRVVDKRKRPVLLLDVSRFRGRGDPKDGKGIEPLDLRIVLHRGQEVEEARPSHNQSQHLARFSDNIFFQHTSIYKHSMGWTQMRKGGRGALID